MKQYIYTALIPKQSPEITVLTFCAKASDILNFSRIDRIERNNDGKLKGFQRPQIANHINEIRDYLGREEAILPNSIVVAFTSGVSFETIDNGLARVTIDPSNDVQGLVVDGQQRLTALSGLPDKEFEVFVSCILCNNEEELRKQFILINNTRPLPKTLIFELLPTVNGLPHRLSSRSLAASLVERLNYDESSSLHRQIKQHTNPTGYLKDTSIQKLIINSLNDGAFRNLAHEDDPEEKQFELINNYFKAIQEVFPSAWHLHKPNTSRLVHSAGILAMGYVMEHIYAINGKTDIDSFKNQLYKLVDKCSWTEGHWDYGDDNKRPWNGIQSIPRDYIELAQYLIRVLKRSP